VSVPVQLLPAHKGNRKRLREIADDGTPLRRRFFCPRHNRAVSADQTVRGFEYEPGRYVVVTAEELESLEPKKSREIDLRLFVESAEISPYLFDRSYYLVPDGDSTKAYRLLARILEKMKRAGIATFVMHDREYAIAIFGERGILRGQTLRFPDEIRKPDDLGLAPSDSADVDLRARARFERAIEKLSKPRMDTRALEDEFAARLLALANDKWKRGKDVFERPAERESSPGEPLDGDGDDDGDLLETIRRSLRAPADPGSRAVETPFSRRATLPRKTALSRRRTPTPGVKVKRASSTSRGKRAQGKHAG
jgi:DNA end-binding protein Ku